MNPRTLAPLVVLLGVFSAGVVAPAEKPQPSTRLNLRLHGYRTDGQLAERTRLGFLSDDLIVVNLDQVPLPPSLPGENRGTQASASDSPSLPPVQTLVFDLRTKKLVAQGRLGGNRLARNFGPTRDGRFVVRTYTDLRLFSPDLKQLASFPLPPQPVWTDFQVTPDGRRIVVPNGDWLLILDADSLVKLHQVPASRNYATVFDGDARLDWGLRPGISDKVFLRVSAQPADMLYQAPDNSPLSAAFLADEVVYVERDDAAVVLSADGKQLYSLKLRGDAHLVHTSLGGQRFALESLGATFGGRLLHPLDRSGQRGVDKETVEVFEVGSGKQVFALEWRPGRHPSDVALSPDGLRLALIRGGFLEVYDLPPLAQP